MNSFNAYARFSYSLFCYLAGVGSLAYFIAFTNDLYLGKTINTTLEVHFIPGAIVMNILALSLFGLQHSVMARASFKSWLTRHIHPSMERSTYILMTALAIAGMCALWVPFGPVVWQVESSLARLVIQALAWFGWCFLLLASFQLNHFELFGLSQTFNPLIGRKAPEVRFKTPFLYRFVRHPIQTGVLIGMWSVPTATLSHTLFAGGMTLYVVIGLYFEEKDLIQEFGTSYLDYMGKVKRLIPFIA